VPSHVVLSLIVIGHVSEIPLCALVVPSSAARNTAAALWRLDPEDESLLLVSERTTVNSPGPLG
jgi:hypothetical protein